MRYQETSTELSFEGRNDVNRIGYSAHRPLLLEQILSRRSVHPRRMVEPGPAPEAIHQIVSAAVTAPDHSGLTPWRFIVVSGEQRTELGEVLAQIKARKDESISAAELERERDRARSVPVLIAVVSRLVLHHPIVPVSEQYASIGAAIQNMLLSAHVLGFAAKMVSGRKIQDRQLAREFRLAESEALFGFICLGTSVAVARPKTRVDVAEVLSGWEPLVDRSRAQSPDITDAAKDRTVASGGGA